MRIDWWTLALQTVNVLILIWILSRFLFRPVADIVARRQQEAANLVAEAAATRQAAAALLADADKARAGIAAEHDRLIAEARTSAAAERTRLLGQSSEEMEKLRQDAEAAILRRREAAKAELIGRARELSLEIARRLLARFPPDVALKTFLDGLCGEIRALAAGEKHSLAASAGDHPIEVVTAAPLADGETEQIRGALATALGTDPPLRFRHDPALLAGIEINGRTTILRNSWRQDLFRIGEELGRDTRRS
jgi:F-type H+-transporting ATPase subunit b